MENKEQEKKIVFKFKIPSSVCNVTLQYPDNIMTLREPIDEEFVRYGNKLMKELEDAGKE